MLNISCYHETWHSYILPKEDPKNTWITRQMLLYQEMQIQMALWYIISSSFNFFESSKIVLINMVTILMMSAKMVTLGLLKIKVFWNKGRDVIISVHDFINKLSSRESSYIVDMVMWPKFGNSSICIREVIITSIL